MLCLGAEELKKSDFQALLRVWWLPKSSSVQLSIMEPHVMAFGVTNLGVVLVPYPPNS